MNFHTLKVCEYLDYHIQPVVEEISSQLKIQRTFLGRQPVDFVSDNSYLFSLDIKSLYTNILNAEGIKYVNTSLESYSKRSASIEIITKFLLLILTQKNFIFNCKNYSHIKGTLMGTICALSYANILMEHFEGKFIYPPIKTFLLIYLRFIDDIFFLWTGSKKDLENLLNKLNTERSSIKFKCKVSKEIIFFLDTKIYVKNKKLRIRYLERKQTHKLFLTQNIHIA